MRYWCARYGCWIELDMAIFQLVTFELRLLTMASESGDVQRPRYASKRQIGDAHSTADRFSSVQLRRR